MSKRAVFVETQGALLDYRSAGVECRGMSPQAFVPGVVGGLSLLAKSRAFDLILVERQDEDRVNSTNVGTEQLSILLPILQGEGVTFADTLSGFADAEDLEHFCIARGYDIRESSYVAGAFDSGAEVLAGELRKMTIDLQQGITWGSVAQSIVAASRSARVKRLTAETSIELDMSLAGGLGVTAETGLGFFDHMLMLLLVHAGFSATLRAVGDLHVDEHHLVEDVGLVLGQAIREALGEKRGIARYGFLLPMDEALAEVAIDLAGRYEFVWSATWARERLGDMPTELFRHFFKSLAESLRCCLHMSVRGEDQHHKAEALFKGMGRVLRTACACETGSNEIPSSKGVL